MSTWHRGNANDEPAERRGWLLGHFIAPPDPVRTTGSLEVKWFTHPAGDRREEWVRGEQRSTLLLMVSGRFRLELPGESLLLCHPGDYVVWGPGTDHSWAAEEESVMVTVRWPSI